MPLPFPIARRQAGLSLVELMIGIAVGLFIVAAATFMLTYQLKDTRKLLLETQLEQELRAAADLMAQEIRRANYMPAAGTQLAANGDGTNAFANAAPLPPQIPGVGCQYSTLSFAYSQSGGGAVTGTSYSGFRLVGTSPGRLDVLLGNTAAGAGNWQPLTDDQVVDITKFCINPVAVNSVSTPYCSPGTACKPTSHAVQAVDIQIFAKSVADPNVQRELHTHVRLRNDPL